MNPIENIIKLAEQCKIKNANEAETRFKIIDQILQDVLEWTLDDISVEDRVLEDGISTYSDYIIRTANAAIVIEAKKIGVVFETVPKNRRIKLSKTNLIGAFGEAITQAREYCRQLSIPFAVVTNGDQWVIFPATRIDQVGFHESYAVVFNSIQSILRDDLKEFSNLLSRTAVINSSLENTLIGDIKDQIEERRLKNQLNTVSGYISINPMYPLIENEITMAFSDTITDMDTSLFEKCYVNTAERVKFDRKINMYISKSKNLFTQKPIKPLSKSQRLVFTQMLSNASSNAKPLAIVIMGTVGAGKTTFQHYTRNVSSQKVFEQSINGFHPKWYRIDFLEYTDDENPIDFVYKKIYEYIYSDDELSNYEKCIKFAYENHFKHLINGPAFLIRNNKEDVDKIKSDFILEDYRKVKPYVDTIVKYTAGKVPVYLVIDNVDQLSEDVQSKVFSDSASLAHNLKLNLIISIRNSTYIEHKNSAVFNAFDFDSILIEPPKVESVLSKRFFLAKNLVRGKKGEFQSENGAKVNVDDLATVIELVQSSVLGTEIGNLLEVLAAGDIRNALRMTRHFLEHGYSSPGKALQIYKDRGTYILPRHEALRAILLGNHAVYSEETSLIGNPLDSKLGRTNLQMIRMFILSALVQYSTEPTFEYLPGETIRENMRSIGIADEYTLRALSDLCKLRFLHTASHNKIEFSSSFYPSRLGGYIVRDLICNMTYIENIMMDTFISCNETWNNICKVNIDIQNSSHDVVERLKYRKKRISYFYSYIKNLYSQLVNEGVKRRLSKEWNVNPFVDGEKQLERNMEAAVKSAIRNYQKH